MRIARHEITPRYAQIVVHDGLAYMAGQIADDMDGDIRVQTAEVLVKIDKLLATVGSSKSHLLSLNVWVADFADYAAYNEVYDEWLDSDNKPARATVRSELVDPRLKVEMMAVAAVPPAAGSSTRRVDQVAREITYLDPAAAIERVGDEEFLFVDIRDSAEREDGAIPGSVHAQRGMLEWSLDPTSASHDARLTSGRTLVMVCGGGGRAALATKLASGLGIDAVCLRDGMRGWRAAGGEVESPAAR
jgi:enamine deaminase RidA (YjgF/YER057c/UK114 family)/rhodanese-related sulfurtransferase